MSIITAMSWAAKATEEAKQEMQRMKEENERLRVALMTPPKIEQPPRGMNAEVAQMVLDDLWQYSISGIEQHRPGTIIAIGPGDELLKQGSVRGVNHWDKQPRMRLSDAKARDSFKKFMIQDGAQILEASDGSFVANDFFSCKIDSRGACGGSGAAAAQNLSKVPGSIVFKVSADGGLKEFRAEAKAEEVAKAALAEMKAAKELRFLA